MSERFAIKLLMFEKVLQYNCLEKLFNLMLNKKFEIKSTTREYTNFNEPNAS